VTLPYLRISPASVQTPDSTWYWDCTGGHRTSRSQQLLQQRLFLALPIATLGSAWVGPIGTCHRTTLVKAISQWESRKKRHQFLFAVKIPPNKNCEPQWKKTGVVRYLQCIYNTHFGGLHIAFWCLVINPPQPWRVDLDRPKRRRKWPPNQNRLSCWLKSMFQGRRNNATKHPK